MKTMPFCLYRSPLHALLQDGSERLEQLMHDFGLLFFSVVIKYAQENFPSCTVELYSGRYLKMILDNGRTLEAFKKANSCYFQFQSPKKEGDYCIQYSGTTQYIRRTREILPLEPFGALYFDGLEEARAFFNELRLNAILYRLAQPAQQLDLKLKTDPLTIKSQN